MIWLVRDEDSYLYCIILIDDLELGLAVDER